MSINWKVRFKNKVWLTAFLTFLISAAYQLLAMFEVDPTTKGLGDSARALGYDEPN